MSQMGTAGRVNRRLVVEALVALAIIGGLTLNLRAGGTSFNSQVWPLVILALMGAVSAVLLLGGLFGGGRRAAEAAPVRDEDDRPLHRYGMIAAFTALVLLLPSGGFALTTLVFVPVAACILGMPRNPRSFAVALAIAFGIYLTFTVAFEVPLPSGMTAPLLRLFGVG